MSNYRAKLLPLMRNLGFVGRDGRPSISNFETTLANAFERGEQVTIIIGDKTYPQPDRVQPESEARSVDVSGIEMHGTTLNPKRMGE